MSSKKRADFVGSFAHRSARDAVRAASVVGLLTASIFPRISKEAERETALPDFYVA